LTGQADGIEPVDQGRVLDDGLVKGDAAPAKGLDLAAVDGDVDLMIGVVGAQQGQSQGAAADGPGVSMVKVIGSPAPGQDMPAPTTQVEFSQRSSSSAPGEAG